MKVYVCQRHPYDGGDVLAVFDSLDGLKQYMKDNKGDDEKYLIPHTVCEMEMNESYQSINKEKNWIPDKDLK